MYSAHVLEHFQNPRGVGDLHNPSVSVELQNPVCGDVLRLSLVVEDGRITDVGFRAKGCVPAIACGSKLSETLKGMTVREAALLTSGELESNIGGLPPASRHASALAIDALKTALKKLAS